MNIFTIYKTGQTIPYKVLEGISKQSIKCNFVPITQTKGKTPRLNSVNNWITALEYSGDVFIGMDSDVVMDDPKTIETLIEQSNDCFMATIRSQIIHVRCTPKKIKLAHSLFICKQPDVLLKALIKIKRNWTGECPMCRAINKLASEGYTVRMIAFPTAYECCRETLIKEGK